MSKLRLVDESGTEVDVYSPEGVKLLAHFWIKAVCQNRLMYEPTWLGIPVIQDPNDLVMLQELIWRIRPDIIIETGIAHGGTAVFYASMLELLNRGKVISIDVEIRQYNRVAISSHPLSHRIEMIEGSSTDAAVVEEVKRRVGDARKVLVTLDSNHSYDHVLKEMELYAPLVTPGSYLVAMDGIQGVLADIPMGKPEWREDNPLRAIHTFLETHTGWEIDPQYNRMLVTTSPDGYLRRTNIQ